MHRTVLLRNDAVLCKSLSTSLLSADMFYTFTRSNDQHMDQAGLQCLLVHAMRYLARMHQAS